MSAAFRAFRVFDEEGKVQGRVVEASLDELSPGGVVIDASHSSVNYKDALAATGAGRIIRRLPLIAGIDVAGTVASSTDGRFHEGQPVLVTGYDLGVAHDGGYAGVARVPAEWVVAIPAGLDPFDAMAIGTAGFTAALSIVEMERNGLAPSNGPVIVTGATGGVGSPRQSWPRAATGTALTGRGEHELLGSLGAVGVMSQRPLADGDQAAGEAARAGAVDVVGGAALAWLTRTMSLRPD
jgi:NADPH2:quinone reductase